MDSDNSGSMQSSSGGDEEYDSRSESISAFVNNSSGHIINQPQQQQQQPLFSSLHHLNHTHNQTSMLDPISNYLDPFSRSPPPPNQNPQLNFDMVWARGIRSEPNCTDTGALMGSSSSSSSQLILGSHHQDYSARATPLLNPASSSMSSLPHKPSENVARDHHHQATNNNTVRNSKKRSRASRRAPTTVLTTDTSNFRAMVQEFTGIPAPPFSVASPFSRTRLDLYRSPTTIRSAHLEPTPSGATPYLLRPFAHKVQPTPYVSSSHSFSSSSIMADGIVNSTTSNNTNTPISNATSTNNTTTPSNFASTSNYHGQVPSDQAGLPKQTQNFLNMQNPVLTFQSLLNASPPTTATTNYLLPNVPNISSTTTVKSQGSVAVLSNDIPHLKMGLLEELDMNHHGHVGADQVGGLPINLVVKEGMPVSNHNSSRWGDGMGLMHDGNDQVPQRSFHANYGSSSSVQQVNGSSSDFHAEKASDQNISSKGEGMVDSWICSSD